MTKKILHFSLLFLVFCVQCWTLYLTLSYPAGVIDVVKDTKGEWLINRIQPENTPTKVSIHVGDKVLKVNGKDVNLYFTVTKWHSIDQYNTITLDRDGKITNITAKDLPGELSNYMLASAGEIVSFAVALLLFRKSSISLSAKHLSFVFWDVGIIFLSLGASTKGDALGKCLIDISMMLLPVFFLHFLMVLINEARSVLRFLGYIRTLYAVVPVVSLLMFNFFINHSATYYFYRIVTTFTLLFFVFGILLNLVFLTVVYFKNRRQKSYISLMVKTIWVALFISFAPIVLLSFLPKLLTAHEFVDSFYMSWFVFILPLTFAYLIMAERLYDIDMLVRRILLNVTVSFVPCIGLTAIMGALFPQEADARRLTIIFVLLLACMTFVLYSFEYFTTKLQPVLFPRKHQLQVALKKIAAKLSTTSSFRDLKDIILVDIVNTLQVVSGAIVFRHNDAIETISEGSIDLAQVESMVQAEARRSADYSLIKINLHEEYTSYLIIGRKITGTMLGTEELQWIGLITSYLAVSLENVYLIRKLTLKLEQLALQIQNEDAALQLAWFRKLMFDLQERERTRIATELHDTTMQDLFFLKGRLHSLLEKYAYSDEDRAQLESMMDYIDIINMNLRQSCFELHPYMLKEIGLVKTIERLVAFEKPISTFELTFRSSGAEFIEQKDLETKRHMFRMVQELINNAKKHAEASRVRLVLTATAGSIYFEYEDNGVGFDPQRKTSGDIGGSGIGMDQIRSRIFSLNGQFELVTGKGKGVKIVATIPVQEGLIA